MYCKKCGNRVEDGAAFCTNCGAKLDVQSMKVLVHKETSDKNVKVSRKIIVIVGLVLGFICVFMVL